MVKDYCHFDCREFLAGNASIAFRAFRTAGAGCPARVPGFRLKRGPQLPRADRGAILRSRPETRKPLEPDDSRGCRSAQNRTRTCTSLLRLVPETSASTNSAIWARLAVVPRTRLELARRNRHHPLKVARLPIPPPGLNRGAKLFLKKKILKEFSSAGRVNQQAQFYRMSVKGSLFWRREAPLFREAADLPLSVASLPGMAYSSQSLASGR